MHSTLSESCLMMPETIQFRILSFDQPYRCSSFFLQLIDRMRFCMRYLCDAWSEHPTHCWLLLLRNLECVCISITARSTRGVVWHWKEEGRIDIIIPTVKERQNGRHNGDHTSNPYAPLACSDWLVCVTSCIKPRLPQLGRLLLRNDVATRPCHQQFFVPI